MNYPYTVTSKVRASNGFDNEFKQDFLTADSAMSYKRSLADIFGDQLVFSELIINDTRTNKFQLPPKQRKQRKPTWNPMWQNPWNKTGKVANGDFIRNIAFHNAAFVTYIGYTDGTHQLFVSGRKSTGEGVPFSLDGFDYYKFVSQMAHTACSWKEAKYLAHHIQEIMDETEFLTNEMKSWRERHALAWGQLDI